MITMDSDGLKHLTHGATVPFAVKLDADDSSLICTEILRIIPGRRIVCKARLHDSNVIAKVFLDPIHAPRHLKRETAGIRALHASDIPTPQIITEATVSHSIKVLVTEYLADAERPGVLLKLDPNNNDARDLLKQFFVLIAKLHKAGLAQNDLHFDNFLLKDNTLYAIDAANLKHANAPLPPRAARENLALFFSQFDQDYYPALLESLESYNNIISDAAIDLEKLLSDAKTKRKRIWKAHSKKYFRNCTNIVRKSNLSRLILCKRKYYNKAFVDFLNNPNAYIEKSPLLKDGNSSTVALIEIDGCKYVVKRFNIKNCRKLIRRQFPPARTRRNWLLGHLLLFNNIPTPEPIAMVEKRFGLFRTVGYVVTEYIDAPNMRQLLEQTQDKPQQQEELIRHCVSTLHKLHGHRITHGDLKDSNFLCTKQSLYMIDLDAMKLHKSGMTLKRAIKKDFQRLVQNYQTAPELLTVVNRLISNLS